MASEEDSARANFYKALAKEFYPKHTEWMNQQSEKATTVSGTSWLLPFAPESAGCIHIYNEINRCLFHVENYVAKELAKKAKVDNIEDQYLKVTCEEKYLSMAVETLCRHFDDCQLMHFDERTPRRRLFIVRKGDTPDLSCMMDAESPLVLL